MARTNILVMGLALVLLCGCDAIRYPPEGSVYRVARELASEAKEIPPHAKLASARESRIQIAKNMASVEIPFRFTSGGKEEKGTYVIWLKRIARRWELDHAYVAPQFDAPSS